VVYCKDCHPNAILKSPVLGPLNAWCPIAILLAPETLFINALLPKAVLVSIPPAPAFQTDVPLSFSKLFAIVCAPVNFANLLAVPVPDILSAGTPPTVSAMLLHLLKMNLYLLW